MKQNNLLGSIILITASVIWGLAFVAQSGAAGLVPPFTFNALRSIIGAGALYVFYLLTNCKHKNTFFPTDTKDRRVFYLASAVCGVCLSISVNFQQFGITAYPKGVASEARSGFITALYVILVPIFSAFSHKKVHGFVWVGVIIAIFGIYMLCFSDNISNIYIGDLLVLLCAISFSFHIMAVDKYVGVTGGVRLSIVQFSICAVVSAVLALIFELEGLNLSNIFSAAPQILYLGIMSSAVAYTLQIVGQKYAEPAVASISMSLESVFAALGGWMISGNTLTLREIFGCALVFAAIIIAQLPQLSKKGA
ncbi:MAG: DMT family transporter [Acutalibacteraceae bacterium]|jgi:drug/metabolite transporter (DMT)-like permease